MSYYEYRVVPAPASLPRVKGAKTPEDRFAHSMAQMLNIEGQNGWEFQKSETLATEVKRGWLSKRTTETLTVLIFRRWVETEPHTDWRETAATPEVLAQEIAPERAATPPQDPVEEPAIREETPAAQGNRLSARRSAEGTLRPLPGTSRD